MTSTKFPRYTPTPEAYAAELAAIRAEWDEQTEISRRAYQPQPYEIPTVRFRTGSQLGRKAPSKFHEQDGQQ